jgi:ribosomal protein L11
MNIKKVTLFIYAQSAEPVPPLGTILGNLGINSTKFCKEFNEFTQDLPVYFKLPVTIFIEKNKSYTFKIKEPQLGYILYLLRHEIDEEDGFYEYINLSDLLKLAKFKYPLLDRKRAFSILFSIVKSSDYPISNDIEEI